LRVYNSNKTREDVAVKLNGKIQKAELTDLKEEFVQELDINENTIKLVIPANKIYTIKFTLTHIGAL